MSDSEGTRRPKPTQVDTREANASASVYDPIATIYDAWSTQVVEDIEFYVGQGIAAGGPVVELGVGTGRIAVPTARAGVAVIGVDSSSEMLELCRSAATAAGVASLVDLRLGDYSHPPVSERVRLVTCPFRAFLHLHSDEARRLALRSAFELLVPGGTFAFDVFAPSSADIDETDGRWIEREPGIWERADWHPFERTLDLSVRGEQGETTMHLAWVPAEDWQRLLGDAGFVDVECFGWFDGRPYAGGEDFVFMARRPGDHLASPWRSAAGLGERSADTGRPTASGDSRP